MNSAERPALGNGGALEVQVGAAKVAKYAAGASGDTLEMIERPHGGLSAVLVDGQRSGQVGADHQQHRRA